MTIINIDSQIPRGFCINFTYISGEGYSINELAYIDEMIKCPTSRMRLETSRGIRGIKPGRHRLIIQSRRYPTKVVEYTFDIVISQ